jgi:hypothetical protein
MLHSTVPDALDYHFARAQKIPFKNFAGGGY